MQVTVNGVNILVSDVISPAEPEFIGGVELKVILGVEEAVSISTSYGYVGAELLRRAAAVIHAALDAKTEEAIEASFYSKSKSGKEGGDGVGTDQEQKEESE